MFLDLYCPDGKRTIPPPALLAAVMAFSMAAESLDEPSAFAP